MSPDCLSGYGKLWERDDTSPIVTGRASFRFHRFAQDAWVRIAVRVAGSWI